MFSDGARTRMLERGWGVRSLLMFFKDSAGEALGDVRRQRTHIRSIVRVAVVFYIATVAAAVLVYGGAAAVVSLARFAGFTALGVIAVAVWACASIGLLRGRDGGPAAAVGLANHLTLARFYLIAPVLVFFEDGHYAASLTVYLVLGLTDIIDGVVARSRGEETEFGVVMDPLADVVSTAAVFAIFLAHGLIPLWLFLILMVRYATLIIGSFVLFLATGPIRFKSTLPGKIVGLVQGTGILIVIVCVLSGSDWLERLAPVLYPVLGVSFASIVLSQCVIGLRHVRESVGRGKAVRVES